MESKKLDLFNLKHVSRIYVVGDKVNDEYAPYGVIKIRNFWGCTIGYKRVFRSSWLRNITFSEALEEYNIKKGIIFDKPYVTIVLSSDDKLHKEFDTYFEAEAYAREIENKTGIKFEIHE